MFLKRGAKLAIVALLMTSLAAQGAVLSCCQRQTVQSTPSDHCSHQMPHMQARCTWQATSPHADCRCVPDATKPTTSPVLLSDCSPDIATANGNAAASLTLVATLLRLLPEKPPPLRVGCNQALTCTFLI